MAPLMSTLQATAVKNESSSHHVVDTAHEDMIVSLSFNLSSKARA